MKKGLFEKMFWSPNYFSIAIRKKKKENDCLFYNRFFDSDIELVSRKKYWKADPFLVKDEDKTFLFYEACHKGKGVIEVVEILEGRKVSKPTIVLEKEYHLSYPFVFKNNNQWYMIPETCSNNSIDLYKATAFPFKWEKVNTIITEKAVDTTVHKYSDRYIMVTFLPVCGSEEVEPKAYWLNVEDNDNCGLEEIEWNEYDKLKTRGAGGFFDINGKLYRPSQINSHASYGEGIRVNEIMLSDGNYSESVVFEIYPKNVAFDRYKFDGLHTYTQTEEYEAIDVRCSFFDLFKPIRYVARRLFAR